jgi:hypothetical protein
MEYGGHVLSNVFIAFLYSAWALIFIDWRHKFFIGFEDATASIQKQLELAFHLNVHYIEKCFS